MSGIAIRLDWFKDAAGYELQEHGKHGAKISRKGGLLVPTQPLRNDRVFKVFANVTSSEGLLEFINHHGFLDDYEGSKAAASMRFTDRVFTANHDYPVMPGEDVEAHLNSARKFRDFLKWTSRRGKAKSDLSEWIHDKLLDSSLAQTSFDFDARSGFQIVLTADTLMKGVLLQLATSEKGRVKYATCRNCGLLFEAGPQTGRRADAAFCSDQHRIIFNSRARTKGKG